MNGMFAKEPRLKEHCDGLLLVAYSELWSLLREVRKGGKFKFGIILARHLFHGCGTSDV